MNRLIILWSTIFMVSASRRSSFISYRDKEFVGPDPRLEQLLRQRMAAPAAVASRLPAFENIKYTSISTPSPVGQSFIPRSDTRRARWFDEYNAENLKPKILQFQQYLIQLSKTFIEEIDKTPLVEKIALDERVRVANIFLKLDQWILYMRTLLDDTSDARYRKPSLDQQHVRRNLIHFYYYQRLLRANIDITYTIEFLIHIHTVYLDTMKRKNRTAGDESDSDDEDAQKESKSIDMYEKLKGKDITPDQERYIIQMMEAGLNPTMPP